MLIHQGLELLKRAKKLTTKHMSVKLSHLNFVFHHEIFLQFKTKERRCLEISLSTGSTDRSLMKSQNCAARLPQPTLSPYCILFQHLCSTQFLPEVTQNNIFSTFKISVSQDTYRNTSLESRQNILKHL